MLLGFKAASGGTVEELRARVVGAARAPWPRSMAAISAPSEAANRRAKIGAPGASATINLASARCRYRSRAPRQIRSRLYSSPKPHALRRDRPPPHRGHLLASLGQQATWYEDNRRISNGPSSSSARWISAAKKIEPGFHGLLGSGTLPTTSPQITYLKKARRVVRYIFRLVLYERSSCHALVRPSNSM